MMTSQIKFLLSSLLLCCLISCQNSPSSNMEKSDNPFLAGLNVPVDYAKVTATDV